MTPPPKDEAHAKSLKPCPFCGMPATRNNWYHDECHCGNPKCVMFEKTITHAVWNTRAEPVNAPQVNGDVMEMAEDLAMEIRDCGGDAECAEIIAAALQAKDDALATERGHAARMREALEFIANEDCENGFYGGGETYYALNKRLQKKAKEALAAPPVEQESAWRDISTAPRDEEIEFWCPIYKNIFGQKSGDEFYDDYGNDFDMEGFKPTHWKYRTLTPKPEERK